MGTGVGMGRLQDSQRGTTTPEGAQWGIERRVKDPGLLLYLGRPLRLSCPAQPAGRPLPRLQAFPRLPRPRPCLARGPASRRSQRCARVAGGNSSAWHPGLSSSSDCPGDSPVCAYIRSSVALAGAGAHRAGLLTKTAAEVSAWAQFALVCALHLGESSLGV